MGSGVELQAFLCHASHACLACLPRMLAPSTPSSKSDSSDLLPTEGRGEIATHSPYPLVPLTLPTECASSLPAAELHKVPVLWSTVDPDALFVEHCQ